MAVRNFVIRYVGLERWKTAEAAREYGEEVEICQLDEEGRHWTQVWLMSDDELRSLVGKSLIYLALRSGRKTREEVGHLIAAIAEDFKTSSS